MQSSMPQRAPVFGEIGEPGVDAHDPYELLVGYLDWYRDRLLVKTAGLDDAQLRTRIQPLGWSPLGLIKHLGWVERRWLRWGFAAEDVQPYPDGGDETKGDQAEWDVSGEPTDAVLAGYRDEVARSRSLIAGAALDQPAGVGGRFPSREQAPTLGRILFHLLQEYARHVGQLDVLRELIDGVTGE